MRSFQTSLLELPLKEGTAFSAILMAIGRLAEIELSGMSASSSSWNSEVAVEEFFPFWEVAVSAPDRRRVMDFGWPKPP